MFPGKYFIRRNCITSSGLFAFFLLITIAVAQIPSPVAAIDSIVGTVYEDMYPINTIKNLEGVSVYLERVNPLIMAPSPVFMIIDSTKTKANGRYAFYSVSDLTERIRFSLTGYYSRTLVFNPNQFSYSVALLPMSAQASIKGTVDSHGNCTYWNGNPLCTGLLVPVKGCTVSVAVPQLSVILRAVTDNSGSYSLDSIPLVENGDTFQVVASAGPGYSIGRQDVVLYNTQTYTVNFNLETAFTNRAIITNDSLRFTVSTDQKTYLPGDSIRVRYSVENTTTHAIEYTYTPGCQYDWALSGIKGDTIYQYMKNRACILMIGFGTLNPGQMISTEFPGYAATSAMDSILTVIAKTFSFGKSDASINITIKKPITGASLFPKSNKSTLKSNAVFLTKSKALLIKMTRSERVSISLYDLTGRKINQVLNRQYLGVGEHIISMADIRIPAAIYLVRVYGGSFTLTRAIHIAK